MNVQKLFIRKSLLAIMIGLVQVLLVACMSGNVKSAPGTTTTIILIRHAEKTTKGLVSGSYLIPEGSDRAQALVAAVQDRGYGDF